MSKRRYLTKSRFKLACECPTKLYYTGKLEYANQRVDDPFLMALARGGFQVGELAKCYFPDGVEVKTDHGDYERALALTNELLALENVTIFEAAVSFDNFFIRVDVLVKTGSNIELIEVKSKSYSDESRFFGARGHIDAAWKDYLYDVAFQKFVVTNTFPDLDVNAFLMLTDKDAVCPTDGLHQKFRIKTDLNGRKYAEVATPLTDQEINSWILRKVNVDSECERIFAGTDTKLPQELSFAARADHFADAYARDVRLRTNVSSVCKACEFRMAAAADSPNLASGYDECWGTELGWSGAELALPTVLDIWDFRNKDKMIEAGKIRLSDLTVEDIGTKASERPGISRNRRQWMQVEKACSGDTTAFIDCENLAAEMATWKFPLHFIDFETATPAIPFNKGRRPYEEIAFQFSHHVVHADGRVEHAGQYLNDGIGVFPNYDFLRALQAQLMTDDGTIFRYAAHENTYLNAIHRQLNCEQKRPDDCDDLCGFIKLISKSKEGSADEWCGERNMVDMLDLVKRYYYHPAMLGSNSIKKVLPAMLDSSDYLKKKYSKAVYNGAATSLNFPADWVWVEYVGESVDDPYNRLPKLFASEAFENVEDEDLRDGGAAMTAYARLQFEDLPDDERAEIRSALLRYCELDTLAMVMIYEGWREAIRAA